MSFPARQSTARTFTVGPVLDADGVVVTGGVIADFKLAKNGAAPAAFNGSATLTHRHTGFYSLAATATDFDTVGTFEVTIDDTVNTCPMKEFTVIEEAVYDALFAASANAFTGAAGSSALSALAAGSIAEATFATTAGSFRALGIVDQGVAQSVTATTVVLRAAAAFGDNTLAGCTIGVKGTDQGYWQFRDIKTNTLADDTANVDAFSVTPTGAPFDYIVFGGPPAPTTPPDVNVEQWNNVNVTGMPMPTYAQPAGFLAATFPGGTIANTTNITAGTLTTVTTATNVTAVNGLAAGVITATAIANDAITDAKIAVPAETAGRPTRVLAMVRRAWEWATNKRVRTRSTGAVVLRNAADSATLETQTQSTAGGVGAEVDTQTQGS